MKDENIFESVQFINEGVLGFLAGCVLVNISLPLILVGVVLATSSIRSADSRRKIKKELVKALKEQKELSVLKNKMKKGVSIISINDLSKYIKISDKDISIIKNNDVSAMAIFDKKDRIIAYCLVNAKYNNITYGYTIVDKSIGVSDVVNKYIMALFELKLGIIGDGIKYFVKDPSHIIVKSKDSEQIKDKANYLSKEESKEIFSNMEDLSNTIYKMFRPSVMQGVSVYEPFKSNNRFYINLIHNKINDAYENGDEYDYLDYEDMNDDVYNKLIDKFKSIMNKLGFNKPDDLDYYESNEEKYKYIHVDFDEDDESMGSYTVYIYSTRKLSL